MITCKLGEKEYFIDFVSGRAMREMGGALEAYRKTMEAAEALEKGGKIPEGTPTPKELYDEMVSWFCLLFKHQFTPDDVYDNDPADRLVQDILWALMAVQRGVTGVLSEFPMKPAAKEKKKD